MKGTDCGSQCSEALHGPWQNAKKRLASALKPTSGMNVLYNMQDLYCEAKTPLNALLSACGVWIAVWWKRCAETVAVVLLVLAEGLVLAVLAVVLMQVPVEVVRVI